MNAMNSELQAAINHIAITKARTEFKNFVQSTMPGYTLGWFNRLLMDTLMEFWEDYKAGKNPRLMIFAPPRSGKSELASRRFPAFLLGLENTLRVMACSYSASLSSDMSKDCQRIIDDEKYAEIFPDTRLPQKASRNGVCSVDMWDVVNADGERPWGGKKGRYISAGVQGPISGKGFDIGIIDDPVKDYADASSATIQKKIWEWYNTTFHSRRDPVHNGIILITTRWHKQDLAGKLLQAQAEGGENWKIVSFPMVCEKEQEVYDVRGRRYKTRKKDEVLFPERMPPEYVESCKTGDIAWSALYQQRPQIAGGNFLKSTWLKRYDHIPERIERAIITGDTAMKKEERHDYSVFQYWVKAGNYIYLVDQIRGKWEAHELKREARLFWKKHGGGTVGATVKASGMYVEDKASGTGLIQDLQAGGYDETTGEKWASIPVLPIERTEGKVIRAWNNQPTLKAGFVWIPEKAEWITDYVEEISDFTLDDTHPHDDQIDPTFDAIEILLKDKGGVDYSGMY